MKTFDKATDFFGRLFWHLNQPQTVIPHIGATSSASQWWTRACPAQVPMIQWDNFGKNREVVWWFDNIWSWAIAPLHKHTHLIITLMFLPTALWLPKKGRPALTLFLYNATISSSALWHRSYSKYCNIPLRYLACSLTDHVVSCCSYSTRIVPPSVSKAGWLGHAKEKLWF
jgi:hypothetical protein